MDKRAFKHLAITLLFSTLFLHSTYADNDTVTDEVNVTIPISCTLSGTGMDSHVTELQNTESNSAIGETIMKAYCNDNNGFSIYAIGFTDDEYGKTVLTDSSIDSTNDIITGTSTSGPTSNWAMKLSTVTNPTPTYPLTIQDSFDSFHNIPNEYTKVAERTSGTDIGINAEGSTLKSTYQAYISPTQSAGTYVGQVKYTLVHPYNEMAAAPQPTASGKICYYANTNFAEGTMGCQTLGSSTDTTSTSAILLASNFSRTGYGFAGWSDVFDYETNANAHFYGPNDYITFAEGQYSGESGTNNGLSLYAIWIKTQGSFQDSTKVSQLCGTGTGSLVQPVYTGNSENQYDWSITAGLDSVSALTDDRDGQTYAIAKLSDGKCWMIENIRLGNTAVLTPSNTNNPLSDGTTVTLKHNYTDTETHSTLSPSSSIAYNADTAPEGWCGTNDEECVDQSRLNTTNTTSRATNPTNNRTSIYSYGHYYNWYSATAGRGTRSKSSGNAVGDICPSGWHMPTGNTAGATSPGEFGLLTNSLGGYKNANNVPQKMDGNTTPTQVVMIFRLHHFPNNFVFSGNLSGGSIDNRGTRGQYWVSTAASTNSSCAINYYNSSTSSFYPGINYDFYKRIGRTVRCVATKS
ncbi:hypothetical protein IJI28_00965 [Candidatus Saccharibacteria bacterium]|nr:hypothetical protein [Candidatus Saccharibacteria bacterium]